MTLPCRLYFCFVFLPTKFTAAPPGYEVKCTEATNKNTFQLANSSVTFIKAENYIIRKIRYAYTIPAQLVVLKAVQTFGHHKNDPFFKAVQKIYIFFGRAVLLLRSLSASLV